MRYFNSTSRHGRGLASALFMVTTLAAPHALVAEEEEPGAAVEALEAEAEILSPWSHTLKLGLFLNQTAVHNSSTSRDSTISGTRDAVSYRLSLDGGISWVDEPLEVHQTLRLRYGRVKEEQQEWRTNSDEVRYDIQGVYVLEEPHFLYSAGRLQTVFEDPNSSTAFSPGVAFIAAGYGQRYKDLILPEKDHLQVTAGVRAQRRWGNKLSKAEKKIDVGLEAGLKYTNTIREGLDWRFEVESFAPFDDLGHITTWAEIGLNIKVTDWVIATLSARAYYETQPDGATSGVGYDSLSLRQEALIGFSWSL